MLDASQPYRSSLKNKTLEEWKRAMAHKRKPERADVVIIGAGASGATAAKVLTERGLRVVALERGPWRKRETFGGDELANVNRYNLWPDPILNPRTYRESAEEEAKIELFCPVPQMVGGGTVHWQGWLPRFTENDFRLRTIAGQLPGTTLVDWPISYRDLEPYYTKVEWAFGVSGAGGVNKYESSRSKDYPCPPLPTTRYGQKFHQGCRTLGYNSFPTPMAALSRPYNGRPVTVQSAFAQQHGDPTGTRSSALSVFIPDALKTGRYDLRPDCYVHEITVDEHGSCKSAVYQDAAGDFIEQEGDIFILSCGAIESARLLLLSHSSRFPRGLANGSDLVGRNATFHEYSAAVGVFDDPIYAWAGGGYVAASSFQFYEHDEKRGFVGGCHIAAAGVGIPLPINWSLPNRPMWGARAKQMDRDYYNHTFAIGMVLHDMPQHENRVELDDNVKDAWGLPVARITNKIHENDLKMGRWVIDRNAEILEAAGAKKIYRVYPERISGNCSHQHGTTRMGNDPASSVLNKWCQAHEVDNLFVVDGGPFPTGTGANPTLTIMANAWRVADYIADRYNAERKPRYRNTSA
jgi:choline dehydrogenase-like flavoprotein